MDATRPVAYDMSHYVAVVRRHWWIIAVAVVIGIAGSVGLAGTRPKEYESTTSLLVAPTVVSANASGGRTSGEINLDTEAQLVTSSDVATAAAKLLRTTTPAIVLSAHVSVSVPANTTVLAIVYVAPTPPAAQAGSHAFATAYLANRLATAQADLAGQAAALSSRIGQQNGALAKINSQLITLPTRSARYANLQSERQSLISQITALSTKLNTLTTTTVTPGQIITDATLPHRPTSPSIPLFLASGALLGAVAGLAAAVARQRVDRRLRLASDITHRTGLALLAQLPSRVKPRFDDVYPPQSTGGRTFNRLRNEVLASLGPADRVIMVTGASRGAASSLVAANLAAALARAGSKVVLVSARLPESLVETAPCIRMLGVSATPGLSDVLAGRVPLETAVQHAPRNPWLRVIATGGTANAAGFMRSQTLREILAELRSQAEYVVIEAPSTAISSDAQSLATVADASIIAVELRRTTRAELLDAAEQLERVSPALLGCVLLPRLGRPGEVHGTPPRPPATLAARGGGYIVDDAPTATIPIRALRRTGPDATTRRRREDLSAGTADRPRRPLRGRRTGPRPVASRRPPPAAQVTVGTPEDPPSAVPGPGDAGAARRPVPRDPGEADPTMHAPAPDGPPEWPPRRART